MKIRTFVSVCIGVVWFLFGASVLAQPRPRPDRASRRMAARLVREALTLARQPEGRESAADRFLAAYEHVPNCQFLANAATLLRQIENRHADARRHAQRVVNGECQPSENGTDRRLAQDVLAALTPPAPPPTPVASPPEPVPAPVPVPPPVVSVPVVPEPIIPEPVPEPLPTPVLPPVSPVRYAESRPVPGVAIGFWLAGGLTLVGGALCLGWYVDAENNRTVSPNVDTARWAQASNAALTVAIPTLITGAALTTIGFAFYALRPTRRVEVVPAISPAFTGLHASLRF